MTDDFRVPGDDGYRYGAYGPGMRLTSDHLDGLDLRGVTWYWPAVPADQETGRRRGWLVLARGPAITSSLDAIAQLRPGEPIASPARDDGVASAS